MKNNHSKKLENFYLNKKSILNKCIKNFKRKFPETLLHGPLLMSPLDNFWNASIRGMIIGQETNGWHPASTNIGDILKKYKDFVSTSKYNTHFWTQMDAFAKPLKLTRESLAWTNINKFDVNKKSPTSEQSQILSPIDQLLEDEIRIIKPNFIFFVTGPDFQHRINVFFPGILEKSIEGYKQREFVRLEHPKLPSHSYRTYHPNYLRRWLKPNEKLRFAQTIEQIMRTIKVTNEKK